MHHVLGTWDCEAASVAGQQPVFLAAEAGIPGSQTPTMIEITTQNKQFKNGI